MANIRTGSIVADIRGKVGDEIYSRNRGGAYVKAFTSPVQPETALQVTNETLTADAVAAWQALTDAERMKWGVLAEERDFGVFEKRKRSGYNEFVSRYRLVKVAASSLNVQPINGKFKVYDWSATFSTTSPPFAQLQATWVIPEGSSFKMYVYTYFSPPVSMGIMSPNSVPYSRLARQALNGSTPVDYTNVWQTQYGDLDLYSGMATWVKLQPVIARWDNSEAFADRGAGFKTGPAHYVKIPIIT